MIRNLTAAWIVAAAACCAPSLGAVQPADPDLIPEARAVLEYLQSVHGTKTLAGMSNYGGWRPVYEMSGRAPAIYSIDAFGWNKPNFGPSYTGVLQDAIDDCRDWWHERGGVVAMQFHWGKPSDPNGSAWIGGERGTGPVDVAMTVRPGSLDHKMALNDLSKTADFLEQLAKARVPVLWRPLHETDGGWFWWTDTKKPENTAALWRIMFNYLVKERGLHNLIWVYSAGLKAGDLKPNTPFDDEVEYRQRFYPGARFVDIAGIDIYPNAVFGWGSITEDTYVRAHKLMERIAPGKILALCESAGIPNPDLLQKQGPPWVYCLPWYAGGRQNPAPWIRRTFNHPHVVTLDELPQLVAHNVSPDVRILEPIDGAEMAFSHVTFRVQATDRDKNLARVEWFLLAGPWKDWSLQRDADFEAAVAKAKRLGETNVAADGTGSFLWTDAPRGWHDVAAVARDAEGATSTSNVVRVTVGLKNLALGRQTRASSDEKNSAIAVDGDLFTAWSGAKKDPQWLAVDLGSSQRIGAVAVTWSKAFAASYRIQISQDGEKWNDVSQVKKNKSLQGDTDIVHFDPIEARHVRLFATERSTNWGGYSVYELAVYPPLSP